MQNSMKNYIAAAIASMLVIGAIVGASVFNSDREMRIIYEAAAPYSYDATEENTSAATTEAAVYSEYTQEIADIIYVYVSSTGKYHARSDCSGMKRFDKMSLEQAIQHGYAPCRRCYTMVSDEVISENIIPAVTVEAADETSVTSSANVSPSITVEAADSSCENTFLSVTIETVENIVYVSSSGKYHTKSDCSGMKRSTEMSLDEAISFGYAACKKCAQ